MRRLNQRAPAVLVLVLGLACGAPAAAADEQLFSQDPAGILELAGQSRLVVERVSGEIHVRIGKEGELRYAARSLAQRREERPVALWLKGRSMILRPVDGTEQEPLLLEVAVSPGVGVRLDVRDSTLSVSGVLGSVDIRAEDSEIAVRSIDEDLDLRLSRGKATVNGVRGALNVEADGVEATLTAVEGPVTIVIQDSDVQLTEALGEVEADVDGGNVVATTVGRFNARVRDGELRLYDSRIGAELRMESAVLQVANSRGEVRVESDAGVSCENLQGSLFVTGFRSDVRATKVVGGPVEVVTDDAAVELAEIEGRVRVQGGGLKVDIDGIKGEASIDTHGSTLSVRQVDGPVSIKAEGGEVSLLKATGPVKIESRDANVHVLGLAGPIELKASGNRVDVHWDRLEGETNQSVENEGGDVYLSFPENAEGTVQAAAPEGRIESAVEALQVSDDGTAATGNLGGRLTPRLHVTSAGDVHVMSHAEVFEMPKTKAKIGTTEAEVDQ